MRFYALLAAFAALLINHAEASEAIDFVDRILTETKKSLEDYTYHLKNLQRYHEDNYEARKKNATASVEASIQELEEVFEGARMQKKNVTYCRDSLKTLSDRVLTKHIEQLDLCYDTNLPNFEAAVRRTAELLVKGKVYHEQLKNIQKDCKDEKAYQNCVIERARKLHGSVQIWKSQMLMMKGTSTRAISDAKRQMPFCLTPLSSKFKLELTAANKTARICVAALPVKKSD